MKRKMEVKVKSLIRRIGTGFLNVKNLCKYRAAVIAAAILTMPMKAYAATDAESAWADTMQAIQPWITRLGIVLIAFGGVEFAIAQQSEDAAQKTRAGRFMIAGAIVVAVSTQILPMTYS